MPESPKKIATSPASPTFAEQCIGKAPKIGNRSFIAREDRLLDLPGVRRPADQDLPFGRIEGDERARAGAVLGRVGLERRGMQHHAFRREGLELGLLRRDEHRPGEQRMERARRHDPHRHAIRRIGAGVGIDDVQVPLAEVSGHLRVEALEAPGLERLVDLAPPDPLLGAGLAHDELVVRRAARVLAGLDDERATLREDAVASANGLRDQGRGRDVPAHRAGGIDAVHGQIDDFGHGRQ